MNPPVLRIVHPDPAFVRHAGLTGRERVFEVVSSGVHADTRFRAGDLLVCEGVEAGEQIWVLVPHGHGRPVLGRRTGGVLYGSSGEKCHPVRWAPAGVVRSQWRPEEGAWAQVVERVQPRQHRNVVRALPRQRRLTRAQLGLFEAEAA